MLPTYLEDSGFFENMDRTEWARLDAYKDKSTGSLIGEQHPFGVEFVKEIAKENSDSLDCGVFVAACTEYISDRIPIPATALDVDYLRRRYTPLLWNYGLNKAANGYVSRNDDLSRPKEVFQPLARDKLIILS